MANVISKKTLEDIRFRSDIVETIGSYLNLQKAGSAFKALCPFHKEKTPSFHVNAQRQIFHCFGCGAGGDVFGFIMQYEGVSFTAAVKMLADRAGIPLELTEDDGHGSDKNLLYKMLAEMAVLYRGALLERKSAAKAREYLKRRELTDEIVDEFMIGYAPDRWDAVLSWAMKKKYDLTLVEKTGQIIAKPGTAGKPEYYDRFRNRLMFPIIDEQNRVVGFSGRVLDEDDKGAKYVNTPETPLFQKGRILYAMNKARRHMVEEREAIICEGQIDVIRCHQAGFKTAVAAQGTAFTEDHMRIVQRYADSAVIVFDPDTAGQDAAVRVATMCMAAGLAVRIASLPNRQDPDAFICKNGPGKFRALLDNAESAVAFQIRVLSSRENTDSEVGVMRTAKAVLNTIAHSPNAVQRAKLIQETAQRLRIPPSALEEDLRHITRQTRAKTSDSGASGQRTEKRPKEEVELCEHLVHFVDCPDLVTLVRKYLPTEKLSDPVCRAIAEASLAAVENGRSIQDELHDLGNPTEEIQKFAARVQMAPTKIHGREFSRTDAVKDLILRLWKKALQTERAALGDDQKERRAQITYDLKRLNRWEDGCVIIEMELSD